jgi:leucyl-tRNA synthetase
MHDTQGDVEPEITEVTLLKFRTEDGLVFPVVTYRPETVYGVTNLWINPDVEYIIAKVDGEKWVASQECFEKLKYQAKKINFSANETISGSKLIGKSVVNPETGQENLVLPASFVDPKTGTGLVMSVPGHAPYDYLALRDLKKPEIAEQLSKYGLEASKINSISPVSIVKIEGYSNIPAGDVVDRMRIESQSDPKAEDATKELYLKEFNEGIMKESTGKYAGTKVSKAKDQVKADLEHKGTAEKFYELTNSPVRCRCGTECVVKLLENQWFINYGDSEWKKRVSQHLERMRIIPEDLRQEYRNVIEWLKFRACARQSGLGTSLPQAPGWTIESLSDSTIYMAYYAIAKYINELGLRAEQFSDSVFDYIFLGQGDPSKLTNKDGLSKDTLKSMRKEFLYWYPLDSRHSARELIPNHLTFFIFNHVAIFPKELWPKQTVNNGMVLMEGKKMSKSIGNTIPIRDAVKRYGADTIKIAVLGSAELLSDANFSDSLAETIRQRLEKFHDFVREVGSKRTVHHKNVSEPVPALTSIDKWMLSVLQNRILQATKAMEECEIREAIQQSFYLLDLDLNWYLRRTSAEESHADESKNNRDTAKTFVLLKVVDTWIRLLTPIAPHVCEEAWEKSGGRGFVSMTIWPSPDEKLLDIEAEERETYTMKILEDTREIIKVTNIKPKTLIYYTSPKWKYDLYRLILEIVLQDQTANVSSIIKTAMSKPFAKGREKAIAKFTQVVFNTIKTMPRNMIERRLGSRIDEREVLEDERMLIRNQFSAQIKIFDSEDRNIYDPSKKASLAQPYRPSIYIEG